MAGRPQARIHDLWKGGAHRERRRCEALLGGSATSLIRGEGGRADPRLAHNVRSGVRLAQISSHLKDIKVNIGIKRLISYDLLL